MTIESQQNRNLTIAYNSSNRNPVDKPRKSTDTIFLIIFCAMMVGYIGISLHIFDKANYEKIKPYDENEDGTDIARIIKTILELLNMKLFFIFIILGILTTIFCVFLINFATKVLLVVAIVCNCIYFVTVFIRLFTALFQVYAFNEFCFILSINLLLTYCEIVTMYAFAKIGLNLIIEVIKESCRVIIRYPLTVITSILSCTLILMVITTATKICLCLTTITDLKLWQQIFFQIFNACAALWLCIFIGFLATLIINRIIAIQYWHSDEISDNVTINCFITICRYHLGTVAYVSSPFVIFTILSTFIKCLKNQLYQSGQNYFILLRCWLNILIELDYYSIGMNSIYNQNFKKSANAACKLILQRPLQFLAVNNGFQMLCLFTVSIIFSIVSLLSILYVTQSYNYENGNHIIMAMSTSLIICSFFFILLPMCIVLNASINITYLCILEDMKQHQESEDRQYLMSEELKNVFNID